ncbi:MAG: hypothetical protein LBM98_05835 [Oscillospiraceae bacterium]|nr:hypothetical protein [Oscillospiraceae bacterium]
MLNNSYQISNIRDDWFGRGHAAHGAGAGRKPQPVIASRGTLAIRTNETGAAIQCRKPKTVCYAPGTGLLRTCNTLRIASVPVLRKDGALRRDVGRTGDAPAQPPS